MSELSELMSQNVNIANQVLLLMVCCFLLGLVGAFGSIDLKIDRLYRYFRIKYEEENKHSIENLDGLKAVYPSKEKLYWQRFKKNIKKLFTKKQK